MPLFFIKNFKILTNMQKKKKIEILVLTTLTVGIIWTILKLIPKSALLPLTILYFEVKIEAIDSMQNFQLLPT